MPFPTAISVTLPPDLEVREYPGYKGEFTRNEASSGIPNGTKIMKTNSEKGDAHKDGTTGTVLGSIEGIIYFIEWDSLPKHAVAASYFKIKPLEN